MNPFLYRLLCRFQFICRNWRIICRDLPLNRLHFWHYLCPYPSKLKLYRLILWAWRRHQLLCQRVNDSQGIQKNNLWKIDDSQTLLQRHETAPWFAQCYWLQLVLKIFTVKLQNVQKNLPFILRELMLELLEISCYHDEKTVRTQSSIKIFVVPFFGKNVLEKKHDPLKRRISIHPTSHQFVRRWWTRSIPFFEVNRKINTHIFGLFAILDIKVIQNHRVVDILIVAPAFGLKIADKGINLKFNKWSLSIQVGTATNNPSHGIDLNGNLCEHILNFLMSLTLNIVKHDINITGGQGKSHGIGPKEHGLSMRKQTFNKVPDPLKAYDLTLVQVIGLNT